MMYWGLLIKKDPSLYWFSIALDMIKRLSLLENNFGI